MQPADTATAFPDRVGRFRLLRRLGEGGLATVYLARHEVLGSEHAIKLLHADGARFKERLVREGQIQARLRHPHIVPVTDVVESGDAVGLVMEYVNGPSLQGYLEERGALPIDEAIELFRQIVDGVAAAHEQRVLHRDLKPANVLLQPVAHADGVQMIARVTDFGIAKVPVAEGPRMTRTGIMMGTPGYMAPEQIGDAAHVDARADIFALGVTLYEMLSGRRPFGDGDVGATIERTLRGQFTPLRELRPRCPVELEALVHRCIATEANDRVPSCELLARLLSRLDLQEAPADRVPTPRPTPPASSSTWAPPPETSGVERQTMVPAHTVAAAPPVAATAVPTETWSSQTLLAPRPGVDRAHNLRRRAPQPEWQGDLLKRRLSWHKKAGLVLLMCALVGGSLAAVGGAVLQANVTVQQEARASTRQQEVRLMEGLKRDGELWTELLALGLPAEPLEQGRRAIETPSAGVSDAQSLLSLARRGLRELPPDSVPHVRLQAVDSSLQRHEEALRRYEAAERAEAELARRPASELAVALADYLPS